MLKANIERWLLNLYFFRRAEYHLRGHFLIDQRALIGTFGKINDHGSVTNLREVATQNTGLSVAHYITEFVDTEAVLLSDSLNENCLELNSIGSILFK